FYAAGAYGHVMVLAAREVLHGGAEAFGREGADVDLQAILADTGAGFVVTAGQDLGDSWKLEEWFKGGSGGRTSDQEVKVADRFAPATQAAGGGDRFDAGDRAQHGGKLRGDSFGVAEQVTARALPVLRDGAKDPLFELRAHARQDT